MSLTESGCPPTSLIDVFSSQFTYHKVPEVVPTIPEQKMIHWNIIMCNVYRKTSCCGLTKTADAECGSQASKLAVFTKIARNRQTCAQSAESTLHSPKRKARDAKFSRLLKEWPIAANGARSPNCRWGACLRGLYYRGLAHLGLIAHPSRRIQLLHRTRAHHSALQKYHQLQCSVCSRASGICLHRLESVVVL